MVLVLIVGVTVLLGGCVSIYDSGENGEGDDATAPSENDTVELNPSGFDAIGVGSGEELVNRHAEITTDGEYVSTTTSHVVGSAGMDESSIVVTRVGGDKYVFVGDDDAFVEAWIEDRGAFVREYADDRSYEFTTSSGGYKEFADLHQSYQHHHIEGVLNAGEYRHVTTLEKGDERMFVFEAERANKKDVDGIGESDSEVTDFEGTVIVSDDGRIVEIDATIETISEADEPSKIDFNYESKPVESEGAPSWAADMPSVSAEFKNDSEVIRVAGEGNMSDGEVALRLEENKRVDVPKGNESWEFYLYETSDGIQANETKPDQTGNSTSFDDRSGNIILWFNDYTYRFTLEDVGGESFDVSEGDSLPLEERAADGEKD